MGLRKRHGTWHYRFKAGGREWSGQTGLAATKRNESAAREAEAKARGLVRTGRAHLLKVQPVAFSDAADQFIEWAKGEYREHPNTWKRLRGSTTSLKVFFGNRPVHSINEGQVEDYKAWRRKAAIKDVSLRHDLHCLTPLFEYAIKHNWGTDNPVKKVDIPSDADAQRIYVLAPAEEMLYLELAKGQSEDLHDLARLMLLQGPRPWCEVTCARVEHVDLVRGEWRIPRTKSKASERILYLTPDARSILARRISAADVRGWLFSGKTGTGHLTDLQISHEKTLAAMGKHLRRSDPAATDPAFVIYDFRHTFATRLAERGCDIATLAKILGHANLRTVQKYIHVSEEHTKRAMALFGDQRGTELDAANSDVIKTKGDVHFA
jgi:site-specific recombinase XerD